MTKLISSAALNTSWDTAKEVLGAIAYAGLGVLTMGGCGDDSETDKVEDPAKETCNEDTMGDPVEPRFTTLTALEPVKGIALKTSTFTAATHSKPGCVDSHVDRCAAFAASDDDFEACVAPTNFKEYCGVDLSASDYDVIHLDEGETMDVLDEDALTFVTSDGYGPVLSSVTKKENERAFCTLSPAGTYPDPECVETPLFTLSCEYDVTDQ